MNAKNNTKNNPEVKPENTTKLDLLELVKLADERKALEAKIAAQSSAFKSEVERIDAEIATLQAQRAEFIKLMGSAGISTGRGRPVGSKNKSKNTAETAQTPENTEKSQVLNVLNGVETGAQPVANIETMPTPAPVAAVA